MILKAKSPQAVTSPQACAGQKQEQDVAFFLRRAYKEHKQVLVINDFKFRFNDETAQIDHLIIYPYGFVLIESKSIKGRIQVNQQQEWTRSYQNRWFGMPSPIKQIELQQALLLDLLTHHRTDILGKLLGIKQQGFRLRCWDHLCAVSSDAVINRDTMPKAISDKLVKTEFLVDKLNQVMNLKNKFIRTVNFTDTRPDFNQTELDSIANFLIDQHLGEFQKTSNSVEMQTSETQLTEIEQLPINQIRQPTPVTYQTQHPTAGSSIKLSCKHCGESSDYTPMYGKFGYYIHCTPCTKNTPMKQACPHCQSKNTKVQKRRETYTLHCQECSFSQQII
ncbi:nuclease-related domain-containing protein [Shewanella sp. Isolate11]|uniref:nuclease-related domain-containing protein n=1 Tax=Shewanella sp. Isolate11 TaxID=2908530 RepID=UPI001EFCA4F7|nr:nuclease-related domain-containing protein [Shewanella sp. Isolate11]MCG9695552.1 NERD domain-containing protein [Shewanella sp. Isolate11]